MSIPIGIDITFLPVSKPRKGVVDDSFERARKSYFSKFDQGIIVDETMKYSITPQNVAKSITLIRKDKFRIVVDFCCGAGGNAAAFESAGDYTIGVDIDIKRVKMTRHNVKIQTGRIIDIIQGDIKQMAFRDSKIDHIFVSPPWGGPNYDKISFKLNKLEPLSVNDILDKYLGDTPHLGMFLPRSISMSDLASLSQSLHSGHLSAKFGPRRLALQLHIDGNTNPNRNQNLSDTISDSVDSRIRFDWTVSQLPSLLDPAEIPPPPSSIFLHPPDYLTPSSTHILKESEKLPIRSNNKWTLRTIGITLHVLAGGWSEVDVLKTFSSAQLPLSEMLPYSLDDIPLIEKVVRIIYRADCVLQEYQKSVNKVNDESDENIILSKKWGTPTDLLSCPMLVNLIRLFTPKFANLRSAKGLPSLDAQISSLLSRILRLRYPFLPNRIGEEQRNVNNSYKKNFNNNGIQNYPSRHTRTYINQEELISQNKKAKLDSEQLTKKYLDW